MEQIAFSMEPSQVKEWLIWQCKIAESMGAVKVGQSTDGLVFFDKEGNEVMRVNGFHLN